MLTGTDLAVELKPAVQRLGGAFMISTELADAEREAGLGRGALYFRGRSAVLGDPPAQVVAELFGIFPRWIFDAVLPAATKALGFEEAVAAYQDGAARWARNRLAGMAEPHRVAALLERVTDQADASGLALFAGWQRVSRPEEALARVGHDLMLLREYRGGVHFAALRAVGLTIGEAVVADPEGGRARLLRTAWQPDAADELIARASERADLAQRWREAERMTNDRMAELFDRTLPDLEGQELLERLRDVDAAVP